MNNGEKNKSTAVGEAMERYPRVLLVDDDVVFGRMMMKVAQREKITLTYFSSVEEVKEKLDEFKFDVAIIDYFLEKTSGTQLKEFLETQVKGVPVILISSEASEKLSHWSGNNIISKSKGPYEILYSSFTEAAKVNQQTT